MVFACSMYSSDYNTMWLNMFAHTDTNIIHHETLHFEGAWTCVCAYTPVYAAQMPVDVQYVFYISLVYELL